MIQNCFDLLISRDFFVIKSLCKIILNILHQKLKLSSVKILRNLELQKGGPNKYVIDFNVIPRTYQIRRMFSILIPLQKMKNQKFNPKFILAHE